MGHKIWGNFGSLPGFGSVVIFASFQDAGKWPSRRQWLNKRVKRARGLLGRCRGYLFGMPSRPQASQNFKDCIFSDVTGSEINRDVFIGCSQPPWASTCRLWLQSNKSRAVNWFSKQSAIVWIKYGA
jgi:hypothetical protein